MKKPSLGDIKNAVQQVKETRNCPVCNAHLEAIKKHRDEGHPQ